MSIADRPPAPGPGQPPGARDTFAGVQAGEDFVALRSAFRRVIFPTTAAFLVWYATYVLLAAFAPGFMGTRLGGSNITVGLLFGLGQFISTFAITMAYRRWADRRLDPAATALRERVEGAGVRR